MKKVLFFCSIAFLIVCTGCKSSKINTLSCTRNVEQAGIKFDLFYLIKYKNNYVTNIQSTEKIVSDDLFVLNSYKDDIESIYEPYKNLKYYNYNIEISGNTLTSQTDIDYTKVDTKKMIEIDSNNSNLIKNGKIDVGTIQSYYQSLGIVCD